MAHYLVTGGAGFIGSHLVDALISKQHQVTVLDNLSTGKEENVNPNAQLVIGDIRQSDLVKHLMHDIDGCFHLAAIVSVARSNDEWHESHSINLGATIKLFEAAQYHKRNIPIIYASSAAVYGNPRQTPIAETHPCEPLSAYGADKLGCEVHASVASQIHNIPTVGLRLFNVYGPRQDPNSPYSGVISLFMANAIAQRTLTLFGDGQQTRDFIYVADVAQCFLQAMEFHNNNSLTFNVCTGITINIEQLAKQIKTTTQSASHLHYQTSRPGDIVHSCGNTQRAKELLSFHAKYSLEDGLQYLYQRYTDAHKIKNSPS